MRGDGTDSSWRDFLPLSAVFAIGLVLSAGAFVGARDYYRERAQQQFRHDATYYGTTFRDDVARHLTSLAAIRAFVSASRGVTRWEFSNYAHQILPQNSGFRAVLWVPRIPRAARQAYEAGLQKDGLYGLQIRDLTDQGEIVPAGEHASYLPISYVEPFDGNDSLVGLDLSRIPRFADIFRAAEQSGRIAASTPASHSLVAGTRGPVVLLAFPLKPPTVAASSDAIIAAAPEGYALGVLQLQTIIEEAMGPSTAPIQAAIAYQENPQAAPGIFSGATTAQRMTADSWYRGAMFHQAMSFDIADRHFLLALRSMDHTDPVTSLYVPAGAALLVLALTALLGQNMSTTILRKRLVERAVVSRTTELRAANETLREEVEQRRQAEAALRIARDNAERANRAKSAFLASMSHELRTPLNAIIGFSSILAKTDAGPRQEDYAGEIQRSGWRLLDLVNDILDLTQMDSAAAADGDAFVYLQDCIAAVAGDAQPAADAAGVRLKSAVPDNLPALYGDGKRLTKALAHLVSNAIKFTPEGGTAVIAACLTPEGMLVLDVTDTGVGMPPEAREKICEAFSQYDGRLGRKYEGVGLGLTYVGKVAELHQAKLDIASEAGKGTRVRLIFDRSRTAKDLEVA